MAIYHCSIKNISRSSGRSSIAAASYRSGTKLYDERANKTHNYLCRADVKHSEIIVAPHAPSWAKSREALWNAVEKVETACNSRTAREIEVALPRELNDEQQIELIREFVTENFVSEGMVADFSIHAGHKHSKYDKDFAELNDKNEDIDRSNPHAHILVTTRPFEKDGQWGVKSRKEYILDENGEKIKLKSGAWKSRKVDMTDWNKKETLVKWRVNWAKSANLALERAGREERIDHRSHAERGIEAEPTIHEGYVSRAIEARGDVGDRCQINREIIEGNKELEQIKDLIEQQNTAIHEVHKELRQIQNNEIAKEGPKQAEKQQIEEPAKRIVELDPKERLMLLYEIKQRFADAKMAVNDALRNFSYADPEEVRQKVIDKQCPEYRIEEMSIQVEELRLAGMAKEAELSKQKAAAFELTDRPSGFVAKMMGKDQEWDKKLLSLKKIEKALSDKFAEKQAEVMAKKERAAGMLASKKVKIEGQVCAELDASPNETIIKLWDSVKGYAKIQADIEKQIRHAERVMREYASANGEALGFKGRINAMKEVAVKRASGDNVSGREAKNKDIAIEFIAKIKENLDIANKKVKIVKVSDQMNAQRNKDNHRGKSSSRDHGGRGR